MKVMETGPRREVNALSGSYARLDASFISREAERGLLVLGAFDDPTWRSFSAAETANPVNAARRYVSNLLRQVAEADADHVDDVVLAASELVTNAIRHAAGDGPLSLRVRVRPRWTHLYVADPDPAVPEPTPIEEDDLSLSGRGLAIVCELGLLWFVAEDHGKTAHAVIMRTGEKLADDERDALIGLVIA